MKRSARLTVALACTLMSSVASASPDADEVLSLAVDTGNWLAALADPQEDGVAWPVDALQTEGVAYDLGSGTAGIVVYLLALHRATGHQDFLELAESGADYLVSLVQDPSAFGEGPRRASLYTGLAGVGVALSLVAEANPDYAPAVEKVVELLLDWSTQEDNGLRWSDEFNDLLYGDAGTILFLADYSRRTRDSVARQSSIAGAKYLQSQGEPAETGRNWRFRRSKDFNLPGFSHGTAGIAFVLGTVGGRFGDDDLQAAASDGFDYIRSISEDDRGRIRIPYGWPAEHWEGLYEFGWAHGLTGTNILATRLQQLQIREKEASLFSARIANTLASIGLPGTPAAPFAEPSTPLDWRFGRASVLVLLSDRGEGFATRDAIWEAIAEAAIRENGMAHWMVDAPAFMGGGEAAFAGVLHGAAGIGLALLRLHASLEDRGPYIVLPDDPLAWQEQSAPR